MVNMYSKFLEECMVLGFKGQSSLAGALSATPTIKAVALKGYTFSSAHLTESDLTGVSAFEQSIDGEDEAQANFNAAGLWLADGGPAAALPADEDDATCVVIYVDHGSWNRLAVHLPLARGLPFSLVEGDQPVFRWPRDGRGIFSLFDENASNQWMQLYPAYWEQVLGGMLGGTARTTIGATVSMNIDWLAAGSRFAWGHKYKSDIPAAWWAVSPPTPKSFTATITNYGTMVRLTGGANAVWTTPDGKPGVSLLYWDDTGDPTTSRLIMQHSAANSNVLGNAPMHGQNNVTFVVTNDILSLVPIDYY